MGKITADPWHFARPELAQKYLQTFEIGLISAQALFAPRRMGKSEFLEQDLIPAAQKSGLLTAHLNLWDAREHPRGALIGALARASSPRGLSALLKKMKAPLKKVKASAKVTGLAEGSVEAELVEDPKITSMALSELLRSFDRPDRKLLLMLDEAQVLASPSNSDLTHSLRAGLDIRKQTIKVVFAGSSESSMRRMFGRATEPFYNWAPIEPFDRLGTGFVTAMTLKVNQLSRYPLSEREAIRAFEALKRTPEFFRRYLQRYLSYAELGSRAALDDTLAHVFSESGYRATWDRLLPADKAILRALAQEMNDLHSLAARRRLGEELGLGKPAPLDTPKNALRRLQKEELVVKLEYGRHQIQDKGLVEWLRQLELEEWPRIGLSRPAGKGRFEPSRDRITYMTRKAMGKTAVALLGAIGLLPAVVPLGLYWLGLSNIEGRPQPPGNIRDAAADRALLQQDLRMNDPIVIEVLNPWSVFVSTVRLDENSRSNRAVGTVAGHYNSDHVKHHGMLWWHLSELSLMIWLSRHWTADEIITAAAALARSHPNPSLQRGMVLQGGQP